MRYIFILHDLSKKQCPNLHAKRLSSLIVATQSLLDGQQQQSKQQSKQQSNKVKTPMIKKQNKVKTPMIKKQSKDTHDKNGQFSGLNYT